MYPKRFKPLRPTLDVLWWMLESIALHDYLQAEMIAMAVQAYLKGPTALNGRTIEVHGEVMAAAKALAIPTIAPEKVPERSSRRHPMPRSDFGTALLLLRRFGSVLSSSGSKRSRLYYTDEVEISNIDDRPYVKTNEINSYHLLYAPNRKHLTSGIKTAFRTWGLYLVNNGRAAESWRGKVQELSSRENWKDQYFSCDP